jgi:hypothetical protein
MQCDLTQHNAINKLDFNLCSVLRPLFSLCGQTKLLTENSTQHSIIHRQVLFVGWLVLKSAKTTVGNYKSKQRRTEHDESNDNCFATLIRQRQGNDLE